MQDRPTATELLDAVREFLERDVMQAVEGRVQFHTRVAINVLDIVRRELELGTAHDTDQRTRLLAVFGAAADDPRSTADLERALALALRTGTLSDEQQAAAAAHVRASVREKLSVANPKYLEPDA